MNNKYKKAAVKSVYPILGSLLLMTGIAALLSSCNALSSQKSQVIRIDGSDTVYPITAEAVSEFNFATKNTQNKNSEVINNNSSGTSAGFKKFCAGETDINNASRPIHDHEMKDCDRAGVRYMEIPIGFDAITIAVNSQNKWTKNITLAEIKKIWEPAAEGKITKWNQIRASWPDRPLKLYGSTQDSGTFDYFTEIAVGKEGAIRKDYTANKSYKVLADKASSDPNALIFIPYAYYNNNRDTLKALAIDNGSGDVLPSRQSVKWSKYRPFSRPLFIYVNNKKAQDNPAVKEFVEFYIKNSPEFVSSVGYVPLTDDGYKLNQVHFYNAKVGTVFGGKSQFNMTFEELLKKEATF